MMAASVDHNFLFLFSLSHGRFYLVEIDCYVWKVKEVNKHTSFFFHLNEQFTKKSTAATNMHMHSTEMY